MNVAPLFALMMLAAPVTQGVDRAASYRPPTKIATASVTIISAERISNGAQDLQSDRSDRQVRTREDGPLIDFF